MVGSRRSDGTRSLALWPVMRPARVPPMRLSAHVGTPRWWNDRAVSDPRVPAYARLLVDCINPESGWQVLVRSQPLGRPLVEEVCRELGRRHARALVRMSFDSVGGVFV